MIPVPVFAYGHDYGNAETCGVLIGLGGRFERRIPSVACPGSWRKVIATAQGAASGSPLALSIGQCDAISGRVI